MADTASEWIDYFMPRAEAGDADAQIAVGLAHSAGKHLEKDVEAAEKWFRQAATTIGDEGYFHLIKVLINEDSPRVLDVFSEKDEWTHPSIYLLVGEHLIRRGDKEGGLNILKTGAENGSLSAEISLLINQYDGIRRILSLPAAFPLVVREATIRSKDKKDPRIRR